MFDWQRWKWIYATKKVVAYGIYSNGFEMIFYHFFWFTIIPYITSLFYASSYDKLANEVQNKFRSLLSDVKNGGNVLITHSCRTIFYCLIKTLLSQKKEQFADENNNNKDKKIILKIATHSIHFGSFYRILKQMELAENCIFDFYEIDFNKTDFTLNDKEIDESKISKCDLIICQHIFAVPLDQTILFKYGKKYNIPILEDCVQSGSLFGKYRGNQLSDIMIWSGGMDKTPSCFGGGFGYFNDTIHGNKLYKLINNNYINKFKIDTFSSRFMGLFTQCIHLCITKNYFYVINFVGLFSSSKWYELALKTRKNKSITPFQHKNTIFLRKPSIYQLYSIKYGLNKSYDKFINEEIRKRNLFLKNILPKYQNIIFPWLTNKVILEYNNNRGISEFTWIYTGFDNDRIKLNDYLCNNLFISLINTTWTHSNNKSNGAYINNNLTYLPNLNELNDNDIIKLAQVLTKYCIDQNYDSEQ